MKVVIRNETSGSTLANTADVADTAATRRKGLLARNHLQKGHGLWLVPCEGVHSFGMKFSIDVVYLDRKYRVRKARTGMAPWRLSFCLLAQAWVLLVLWAADRLLTTGRTHH